MTHDDDTIRPPAPMSNADARVVEAIAVRLERSLAERIARIEERQTTAMRAQSDSLVEMRGFVDAALAHVKSVAATIGDDVRSIEALADVVHEIRDEQQRQVVERAAKSQLALEAQATEAMRLHREAEAKKAREADERAAVERIERRKRHITWLLGSLLLLANLIAIFRK